MLYNKIEKRDYTTLKNAGKGYTLEKALGDKKALLESVKADLGAPEWALGKAEDDVAKAEDALAEFREKTNTPEFSTLDPKEQTVVMLSLGLPVADYEDIVTKVVAATSGADLKNVAKELTALEGKKVLAYELRDKKGNRVPLIEVWEGMKYAGLRVKKTGLKAVERKEESFRKEARKYVAFCILG